MHYAMQQRKRGLEKKICKETDEEVERGEEVKTQLRNREKQGEDTLQFGIGKKNDRK